MSSEQKTPINNDFPEDMPPLEPPSPPPPSTLPLPNSLPPLEPPSPLRISSEPQSSLSSSSLPLSLRENPSVAYYYSPDDEESEYVLQDLYHPLLRNPLEVKSYMDFPFYYFISSVIRHNNLNNTIKVASREQWVEQIAQQLKKEHIVDYVKSVNNQKILNYIHSYVSSLKIYHRTVLREIKSAICERIKQRRLAIDKQRQSALAKHQFWQPPAETGSFLPPSQSFSINDYPQARPASNFVDLPLPPPTQDVKQSSNLTNLRKRKFPEPREKEIDNQAPQRMSSFTFSTT